MREIDYYYKDDAVENYPTIEYPLAVGSVFEQYLLEEEIGLNAPGTPIQVHRGLDVHTGQRVAVKILSLRYGLLHPEEQSLARFKREIQILQRLRHLQILPILNFGFNARYMWMVSPYCALGNLADYLDQHDGPLPVEQACAYASQICRALQAAHEHHPAIIHRDVKPANILLRDEDTVLLCDFGIAHIAFGEHLTLEHRFIGTLGYMAPEQFLTASKVGSEYLDPRVDVYALGCVLYEMLSGKPPFTSAIPEATALAHLHLEPVQLYKLNPAVNKGLALIVQRALAKDPNERYQSAKDFAAALLPFVEE